MPKLLVLGDDLTGSNATGALYARSGLRAVSVNTPLTPGAPCLRAESGIDAPVVNLGTRHVSPPHATQVVREAGAAAGRTLRGRAPCGGHASSRPGRRSIRRWRRGSRPRSERPPGRCSARTGSAGCTPPAATSPSESPRRSGPKASRSTPKVAKPPARGEASVVTAACLEHPNHVLATGRKNP
ncbi:four-carbon acid sugar kinase family protein [Amycolatopsis sp. NPDC051102]|uniref:four-carbon acid sugar kinase family protein n=1 Tax=Amycolatopsis sp. NPDC051102 TaxID=3155163 RepID=UPI003448FA79